MSASPRQRSGRSERAAIEIQIHPGSVRWGVRYIFLSRRGVRAWMVLAGLLAASLVFGIVVLPWAVSGLFRAGEYRSMLTERELQGGRLQALSRDLEELHQRATELRTQMERIYLTYGMSTEESIGQGGFPFAVQEGVESIYSDSVMRGQRFQQEVSEQLAVLEIFVGEVESFEQMHIDQIRTTPSISPLEADKFVLTSPFGSRRSPFTKRMDLHPGLDLASKPGTPIAAPADGVVVFAGRYPSRQSVAWWRYGNLVAIRHGERFITLFGHCEEILVRSGQEVRQREVIATVGNTGWSTSPHLHYEVRNRDDEGRFVPVDPRVYILDHRWRDQEQLLVRARRAPDLSGYEPLPRLIRR